MNPDSPEWVEERRFNSRDHGFNSRRFALQGALSRQVTIVLQDTGGGLRYELGLHNRKTQGGRRAGLWVLDRDTPKGLEVLLQEHRLAPFAQLEQVRREIIDATTEGKD